MVESELWNDEGWFLEINYIIILGEEGDEAKTTPCHATNN